eukprot:gene2423-4189_t
MVESGTDPLIAKAAKKRLRGKRRRARTEAEKKGKTRAELKAEAQSLRDKKREKKEEKKKEYAALEVLVNAIKAAAPEQSALSPGGNHEEHPCEMRIVTKVAGQEAGDGSKKMAAAKGTTKTSPPLSPKKGKKVGDGGEKKTLKKQVEKESNARGSAEPQCQTIFVQGLGGAATTTTQNTFAVLIQTPTATAAQPATVGSLKDLIGAHCGVECSKQTLFLGKHFRPLEDDAALLAGCGIRSGATITVVLGQGLPGGADFDHLQAVAHATTSSQRGGSGGAGGAEEFAGFGDDAQSSPVPAPPKKKKKKKMQGSSSSSEYSAQQEPIKVPKKGSVKKGTNKKSSGKAGEGKKTSAKKAKAKTKPGSSSEHSAKQEPIKVPKKGSAKKGTNKKSSGKAEEGKKTSAKKAKAKAKPQVNAAPPSSPPMKPKKKVSAKKVEETETFDGFVAVAEANPEEASAKSGSTEKKKKKSAKTGFDTASENSGAAKTKGKKKSTKTSSPAAAITAGQAAAEALLDANAFCGQKVRATSKPSGKIPSKSERATAEHVTTTKAALKVRTQQNKHDKNEAIKMLFADDGRTPVEAALVWLEGRAQDEFGDLDYQPYEEAKLLAINWLVKAMSTAHLDPLIKEATKDLLMREYFIANLEPPLWDELQMKLNQVMAAIGETQLLPLYEKFDLGNALSNEIVSKLIHEHPAASGLNGRKPSQELVQPKMVQLMREEFDFKSPAAMSERVGIHVGMMIETCLKTQFEKKMRKFAAKFGFELDCADPKGFPRRNVKVENDYYDLPSPKFVWLLDGLRVLLTGNSVLDVRAAIGELNVLFGGLINVKNPFPLDEKARALRSHLLLLNLSAVFDSGITFKKLLAKPETSELLAKMRASPAGEPLDRWQRHHDQAVAFLNHESLAEEPISVIVELQITFTAFGSARSQ